MLGALAGQPIGQYQMVEQIGQGGMATVYKAFQPSLSRYVAIKVLSPELVSKDPNFAKRFESEARAVAALEQHPHILPVYDFGSQDGLMYMVMRLLEGGTLATLMYQYTLLPTEKIVKIVGDIAAALDYAHTQGIVHRDVKPSNILIDQFDEVQLTDFGLARVIRSPYTDRLTSSGTVVGTASYMAPEQAADEPLDGRSDIYSLGVILFELLTGSLPFMGDTPVAIAIKHVQAPIPSLQDFNPNVPKAFAQIVYQAMAKYPDQRFERANEMKQALQLAAQGQSDVGLADNWPELPSQDAIPISSSASIPLGIEGESLPHQASTEGQTAILDQSTGQTESPSSQTGPIAAPVKSRIKQGWLWGGLGLLAGILIAAFFFWRTGSTPDGPVSSQTNGVEESAPVPEVVEEATPIPEVPPDSLLNQISNGDEIGQSLGEREGRHPRQPYSRQIFADGMMYWWDNPDAPMNAITVVYGDTLADNGDKWSRHSDTWGLGEPEVPVNDCPMTAGENGPGMGFGKLWCYDQGIRTDLGSPSEPEGGGIDAIVEIFSGGTVFSIPIDNQIWVLFNDDGIWQRYDVE